MIVVDNAGSDGTAAMLRADFPKVDLVISDRNVGATGGRNLGMERAAATGFQYVFLAEDDTVCDRVALDGCLAVMNAMPDAGLVGASGGSFRAGRVRWGTYRRGGDDLPAGTSECDFVHLDSCLVRLDPASAVGYLREDFFIMFEEQEFGRRLRRSGAMILRVEAPVDRRHLGAKSSHPAYPWRSYYQSRNHLRFCIDEGSPAHWVGFVGRFSRQCLGDIRRGRWVALRFRTLGAFDALRGRMGQQVEPPPFDRRSTEGGDDAISSAPDRSPERAEHRSGRG